MPGHAAGTIQVDSSWSLSEIDLDQSTNGFPYFVQARPQNLPSANQSVAVPQFEEQGPGLVSCPTRFISIVDFIGPWDPGLEKDKGSAVRAEVKVVN